MRVRDLCPLLVSVVALCGCSASSEAVLETVRSAIPRDAGADRARLNPNFRYLRVTVQGRVALLALGNVEPHPAGPIEVWYSAEREVVRLQDGRVVGATGLTTEWRSVRLPQLPAWTELARRTEPLAWVRVRDVMPGYRYGVQDALTLRPIPAPERSPLAGAAPARLAWFEETGAQLPPARYALDPNDGAGRVLYGEQCLAPELCFAWQRWDPVK